MDTFLHKRFKFNLIKSRIKSGRILVALSSGQDSICALKLLHDCLNIKRNNIYAVYIDHQWKKDSKKHARHVVNITKSMKVPAAIYQIRQLPLSENDARIIRYKILIRHALQEKCNTIILGHNSDDKVETLINNIIRGTGLNGITGFNICRKIGKKLLIARPLINFTKTEIIWLCRLFYLPTWSDSTNYNLGIKRNRIRHQLLPYIQNYFNPNIQQALKRFAELCQVDNEYIKESTIKLYIKSMHKKLASLNMEELNNQHAALKKRVIKLYFHYHFSKKLESKIICYILGLDRDKEEAMNFSGLVAQNCRGWLHAQVQIQTSNPITSRDNSKFKQT